MRTPRRARPKTMAGISSHFLSENQYVQAFQNRGIAIENLTVSYVRLKRGVKKYARLSSLVMRNQQDGYGDKCDAKNSCGVCGVAALSSSKQQSVRSALPRQPPPDRCPG